MIRATTLRGRSIVDLDSATKLGQLEELILDPEGQRVAGLVVTQGPALLGDRHERLLPASSVHAVGPDALTVRAGADTASDAALTGLPRLTGITGHKAVTHGGRLLGVIDDILIDPQDGRIVGYALGAHGPAGRLEELFAGKHTGEGDYIRADTDVRVGQDLIVVPDDAVVTPRPSEPEPDVPTAPRQASPVRWLTAQHRSSHEGSTHGGISGEPAEVPDLEPPAQEAPASIHEARTRTMPVERQAGQ
jgi:uncharacterized protein YrrD